MPKTIAITPSWYWPPSTQRVTGVPPFSVYELCIARAARDNPAGPALVSGATRFSAAQLQDEIDKRASAIRAQAGNGARVVLSGAPTFENVLLFFAGLAAGTRIRIVDPHADIQSAAGQFDAKLVLHEGLANEPGTAANGHQPAMDELRAPAVTIDGAIAPVNHSNRSLLAGALALDTFLDVSRERSWIATLPLSRWEGMLSVILPLYLGVPLVLPPAGADPETIVQTIVRERVGYAFDDLDTAAMWTREAKKSVKDARRVLEGFLVSVSAMFDPDARRRVAKAFECPALTIWGIAETGPVFASHQSWYMDESVGIPMTNAQVVPSDPRTGEPIQALWELVESAEVTVWSPSSMVGYEGAEHPERWAGARFRTGMIASSDANGMIYLLGEG